MHMSDGAIAGTTVGVLGGVALLVGLLLWAFLPAPVTSVEAQIANVLPGSTNDMGDVNDDGDPMPAPAEVPVSVPTGHQDTDGDGDIDAIAIATPAPAQEPQSVTGYNDRGQYAALQ